MVLVSMSEGVRNCPARSKQHNSIPSCSVTMCRPTLPAPHHLRLHTTSSCCVVDFLVCSFSTTRFGHGNQCFDSEFGSWLNIGAIRVSWSLMGLGGQWISVCVDRNTCFICCNRICIEICSQSGVRKASNEMKVNSPSLESSTVMHQY